MNREINQLVKAFLEHIKEMDFFSNIEFIILYGSSTGSYHLDESDIDICLYIDDQEQNLSKIRLTLLKNNNEKLDIQIYQLLPLYIQIEVLKGEVLYLKNKKRIYEIAYRTIEDYEEFYPFYSDYINR